MDDQRHLAVFLLDTEASVRLMAEQARFFLVRPRPSPAHEGAGWAGLAPGSGLCSVFRQSQSV